MKQTHDFFRLLLFNLSVKCDCMGEVRGDTNFTYYKDIVNYKKSPPKTLDSRMVFSRVHAGLRSYNGTVVEVDREVVQMKFLYTGASTVALICLIAIAYFYFMMYIGMRKRKINAIDQVNDALINAKMESKIGRVTASLTAALICSFLPSIGITLLGTVYPVFTTNSLSRLMEALVQLHSLVSPPLHSYRGRKIRKAVLELLGMRKPHASQLVAPRFVKANE